MAKVGRPKNPPTCECYAEEVARRRQRRGKNKNLFTVQKFVKTSDYVMRDQNVTSIQLIAELAYYHGYGYLFCDASKIIDKLLSFFNVLLVVGNWFTGSAFVAALLAWLRGGAGRLRAVLEFTLTFRLAAGGFSAVAIALGWLPVA